MNICRMYLLPALLLLGILFCIILQVARLTADGISSPDLLYNTSEDLGRILNILLDRNGVLLIHSSGIIRRVNIETGEVVDSYQVGSGIAPQSAEFIEVNGNHLTQNNRLIEVNRNHLTQNNRLIEVNRNHLTQNNRLIEVNRNHLTQNNRLIEVNRNHLTQNNRLIEVNRNHLTQNNRLIEVNRNHLTTE